MSALNNESNNNNTINTNFTNQVQLDISNNQGRDDTKVTYATCAIFARLCRRIISKDQPRGHRRNMKVLHEHSGLRQHYEAEYFKNVGRQDRFQEQRHIE